MSAGGSPPLRWWGWGDRETTVPAGLAALLGAELGIAAPPPAPPPPALPVLPAPAPGADALLADLRAISGDEAVAADAATRLRHAAGRGYLDLLALRAGALDHAPDAVVTPAEAGEVAALLRACARAGCAVVPFGGGTSVVGGVTPLRGEHRWVIALDTRRLDRCTAVDPVSLTATLGAGMTGPQAEAALVEHGLTLGHFPQSFEYATVGGFAATRSAGQASTGYGRFDALALGLRLMTPTGEITVPAHPGTAAGPSIRQLVLGSEGRFGVITEVTVRVRRAPAQPRYEGWSLPSFGAGVAALRALSQAQVAPDVSRLSDVEETRVAMAASAGRGAILRVGRRYLDLRGHRHPCLLIAGWDSDARLGGARQAEARVLIRNHGGLALGGSPGRSWLRERFQGPYLRDALIDAGVLVETLETATSWSNLERLHGLVTDALRAALDEAGRVLVGCHVSHLYPSGASLYFTVLAPAGADPATRWRAARRAACAAILDNGGTITHHHAIGTEHREHMAREVGADAVGALRALAGRLDPTGIMNPGKLIPD